MSLRQIINISEIGGEWNWPRWMLPADEAARFEWLSLSNVRSEWFARLLKGPHAGRVLAGIEARRQTLGRPGDMIVCHGPRPSFYAAMMVGKAKRDATFLAMSFNYTDLPTGLSHRQMVRSYSLVDRFAVYSRMERKLYAEYFDQPEERFDFVRWAVDPPIAAPNAGRRGKPYLLALGSEARDYPTLMEAARRVPQRRILLIVRPHNLAGLSIPDNVEVLTDLSWDDAWTLAWHCDAMLIPLRSGTTPNGHRTIVGAMQLAKCNIVTDSSGIADYVSDGDTGLLVAPNDPQDIVRAIERTYDEPVKITQIGAAAKAFAEVKCNPFIHAGYFRRVAGLGQERATSL